MQDSTEPQALRLEAELIAAFGTIDSGGLLTNSVLPSGLGGKKRRGLVVPLGCVERAQLGLELLKTAIVDLAWANPDGMTNSDTASVLGLRSDYRGKQKDSLLQPPWAAAPRGEDHSRAIHPQASESSLRDRCCEWLGESLVDLVRFELTTSSVPFKKYQSLAEILGQNN